MDTTSLIVAVASPPGRSHHGIVRMSGPGAIEVLAANARLACAPPRGVHRVRIAIAPASAVPALAIVFPEPHSYSGDDTVEIQMAGNPDLLDRAAQALIATGNERGLDARPAEPGEFTARAWLNGRLDLTQAEGVAEIIAARSDAALRAGRQLLAGTLGARVRTWADELTGALALVEAGIDFTDQEDVVAIAPIDLAGRIQRLEVSITEVLDRAVGTEALAALPRVVLAGRPNAGKSALFNALLDRRRAVVADRAGTTRDALEEPLQIATARGTIEVLLVDTAGDRAPLADEPLDDRVQQTAAQARGRADVVLLCLPCDEPFDPHAVPQSTVIVRTKADLADATPSPGTSNVHVSALKNTGLDELRSTLAQRVEDQVVVVSADAVVLRARHETGLRAALSHLTEAATLVSPADAALESPELVAAGLRAALADLAVLIGRTEPDDVLGRIFASFCVGK